jgi:flagellar basal-body rod protein FlgG
MNALQIAATGMDAQQMRVEVISNNLANMNTTAYNARRAEFADMMYRQVEAPGSVSSATGAVLPVGVQLGMGVRPAAVMMNVQQGPSTQTNGELDVAIEGNGYIEIALPDGSSGFTRDGALKMTGDGLLVTADGYPVVPNITIPDGAKSININPQGEVYAKFDGQVDPELLGQITLATFTNEAGLEASGNNTYRETNASGAPQVGVAGVEGRGTFRQGYLEASSVDAVRQITELIEAQRGYELNAKVITAADQMLGATTQIR